MNYSSSNENLGFLSLIAEGVKDFATGMVAIADRKKQRAVLEAELKQVKDDNISASLILEKIKKLNEEISIIQSQVSDSRKSRVAENRNLLIALSAVGVFGFYVLKRKK